MSQSAPPQWGLALSMPARKNLAASGAFPRFSLGLSSWYQ
ncbi:hypothetical protein BF49_6566 [Bradyrhizobium sp.]|nr:hypothetical protein BF49_6566 [Bradyrhizobium sp.]